MDVNEVASFCALPAAAMGEYGVHGMVEHGVPRMGECGVQHGVPGMRSTEFLGWVSTEYLRYGARST